MMTLIKFSVYGEFFGDGDCPDCCVYAAQLEGDLKKAASDWIKRRLRKVWRANCPPNFVWEESSSGGIICHLEDGYDPYYEIEVLPLDKISEGLVFGGTYMLQDGDTSILNFFKEG